ncbi:MAG: hypothetical protein U0791_15360 [Gemmataceae bacterium]
MLPPRLHRTLFAGILGTLVLAVSFPEAPAQPVARQPADEADDGPDVLARGPVHEAYASTVEMPKAGEIAPKAPPAPIEELPPDQKPEGDNVQWIPGYWDWDDERTDFIWISGFWRVPPPNHVWMPGSWNKVTDGYQWTSGFWQLTQPNQPQPELQYLPPPPQPIEVGPSTLAPDDASVYVTGSWVWRGRYVWRPGYWIAYRPGWIWTPCHYRWTPLGYVFIDGYWDYPLASRGVLFAPVYYPRRVFAPGYYYTPRYVIATPVLFGSLFIRRGYSSYYFGDYYTVNYGRIGYQPWCAPAMRGVAVVPARAWSYDPMWSYYSANYRQTPQWSVNIAGVYAGRYDGSMARPPRTLVQQNQVIQRAANVNNVSNVTNNFTVVNNNISVNNKDVTQHVMLAPLAIAPKLQSETKLQPISQQVRQSEAKFANELRQGAVNRQKAEAEALKTRPPMGVPAPGSTPTPPQPVKVKLEVPKGVVARSQIPDEKRQPPPPPVIPKFDPKANPKIDPMPTPKSKIDPMPTPKSKIDPMPTPKSKIDPMPLPKGKLDPSPTPMPKGRIDPEPKGKADPVPTPKGRIDPPPMPKGNPKIDPPKVDPPKVDPPRQPVIPPKVDPPKPPVVQPRPEPPKPPVVQPRPEPPKPPVVQPRPEPPKPPVVQPRSEPPKTPVVQPRPEPPKPPVVQPRPEPPKPAVQPRTENTSSRPAAQPRVVDSPQTRTPGTQPQPARGTPNRRQ